MLIEIKLNASKSTCDSCRRRFGTASQVITQDFERSTATTRFGLLHLSSQGLQLGPPVTFDNTFNTVTCDFHTIAICNRPLAEQSRTNVPAQNGRECIEDPFDALATAP